MLNLNISDTFSKELPADKITDNTRRQVKNACFSYVKPRMPGSPSLVHASSGMANLLGLSEDDLQSKDFLELFSGEITFPDSTPYAMCYGGHQFGHWAGQRKSAGHCS